MKLILSLGMMIISSAAFAADGNSNISTEMSVGPQNLEFTQVRGCETFKSLGGSLLNYPAYGHFKIISTTSKISLILDDGTQINGSINAPDEPNFRSAVFHGMARVSKDDGSGWRSIPKDLEIRYSHYDKAQGYGEDTGTVNLHEGNDSIGFPVDCFYRSARASDMK